MFYCKNIIECSEVSQLNFANVCLSVCTSTDSDERTGDGGGHQFTTTETWITSRQHWTTRTTHSGQWFSSVSRSCYCHVRQLHWTTRTTHSGQWLSSVSRSCYCHVRQLHWTTRTTHSGQWLSQRRTHRQVCRFTPTVRFVVRHLSSVLLCIYDEATAAESDVFSCV